MNTTIIKREQLSALADGEMEAVSSEAILAQLDAASSEDWELYHRIGDVLRSEELAAPLSAGFAARMAARLDAEAPHEPASAPVQDMPESRETRAGFGAGLLATIRRHLVPGMAGIAALAIAVMTVPQWLTPSPTLEKAPLAAQVPEESAPLIIPAVAPDENNAASTVSDSQTSVIEDDIVRDPRIDQYLVAHQRFSPSAYSSSQFARSATFAVEADK